MFDAYKIGVTLSLTNHVSKGLMAMAGDFAKTEAQVTALQKRIESIQSQAIKGGMLLGAGVGMLALLKGPYEEAKKLAQAQTDFQTLNLSAMENSQAFAKSASMAHSILGTTITDNVKSIHDLHTAFGDLHHAISSADDFAKFAFVAKTMNGGKPVEGLVYNAAKALEHRGAKVMGSDADFKSELDLMERVYLGSRGKVNPSEFFHASQTGKMAYTLMDKGELYGPFAAFMQAKSGATAGTAAMTFASSLIGGHMTSKAKGFLADLGLWDEGVSKKRVKMLADITQGMTPAERKAMGIITPTAGGLKEQYVDLAVHHQSQFVQDILVPAIRKHYGLDMSDEAVAVKLMAAFNRGTSDFMGEYVVNAVKFAKDAAIFKKSMGIGDAYKHYLQSPEGAEEAASAAWQNFLAVFGSVYLPVITDGLLKLASGLDKLSQWMEKDKGVVQGLTYGYGVLASGLALRGVALLATAALRGLGLALLFKTAGGVSGIYALGWRLAALASGINAIAAIAGLATLGATLGSIGVALYGLFNMAQWLDKKLGAEVPEELKAKNLPAFKDGRFHYVGPGEGMGSSNPSLAGNRNGAIGPARGSGTVQLNAELHVDGRKIADVVTKHQMTGAMRPQTGIGRFDPSMNLLSPGQALR